VDKLNHIKKAYNLQRDVDMWKHQQSGKYIIKHDAIERIAMGESIRLIKIETLSSTETLVRYLVTMGKTDEQGKVINAITTTGEADTNNCTSRYIGCMAEKRGIDRAVLKLLEVYDLAMSEIESDSFAYANKDVVSLATDAQKKFIMSLCANKSIDNSDWDFDGMSVTEASEKITELKKTNGGKYGK
tara:strand:- start:251 stop:811 length:561 start_codon:yes stop_codon:yes gene_type:complete